MFARRPFRRLRRLLTGAPTDDPAGALPRRPPRRPLAPDAGQPDNPVLLALQEAHRLKDARRYGEAAAIFEHLAGLAQGRSRPRRTARMYLQAAHCRALGHQPETVPALMKQSFQLLAISQDWRLLQHLAQRSLQELAEAGYPDLAQDMHIWLERSLPEAEIDAPFDVSPGEPPLALEAPFADPLPTQRPALPPKCPYCGAALRSDEVDWIDARSAECPYCGSSVAGV